MTTTKDTGTADLEAILASAATAAAPFGALRPADRATMLSAVARALAAAGDELVPLAMEESALPEARLRGELNRTTLQLRMFAEVLHQGAYLEVTIDKADPEFATGPRPDLRRMLLPLGPVLVFAAGNFPFAFSVAGGDTASALAAGCPVVLKAHPGHPRLSARIGLIVWQALREAGAPEGTFAVIFGQDPGICALRDPRITATSFTGSVRTGRALSDIAASRPVPIPFYGELGSVNPVFVTPGSVAARGAELAEQFVASYTLGVGQFCTSPGLLFLPDGHGQEPALITAASAATGGRMLNRNVEHGYEARRTALLNTTGLRVLADAASDNSRVGVTLLATDVRTLLANPDLLRTETFGPLSIVATYADPDELLRAADALDGNLTATIHAEPDETGSVRELMNLLCRRAGRVLLNGWPTGVSVTPAMHHGGPYPATTAPLHTSVGTASIKRFLRPITFQNVPRQLLPDAVRDDNPLAIPRTVNQAGRSRQWGIR